MDYALQKQTAYHHENEQQDEDDDAIQAELVVLRTAHNNLQGLYDDVLDRVEGGGDYLNYVLIQGTKRVQKPTTTFGDFKEVQTILTLRLLSLRLSGGQMLQNYQLLRELLNPKFTESQQHYQYRQWLELLSRYELEAQPPLDDNLKIATLVNGLRGNLQQQLLLAKCSRDSRELLQFYVRPESYYGSHCLPST